MEEERKYMIEGLKTYGISENVIKAMESVPRHLFVPDYLRNQAYEDHPLSIGHGQTISAPHMVAIMCDLLDLKRGQKALEIGAGSGYHAAVMAELVGKEGHVYTIERFESLVRFAKDNLRKARYSNVTVFPGDGSVGLPRYKPYDRICVTCASPDIPRPFIEQMKTNGKMVIPMNNLFQYLYVVEKKNGIKKHKKMGVAFVPLVGKYGFSE